MPWIIWISYLRSRTTDKGNWHKESIGRRYSRYCGLTFQGFCKTYHHLTLYCIARCMVDDEPVAAGFCIPYQYFVVDFCCDRVIGFNDRINYFNIPNNKSGGGESGEEFEVGMN